MPHTGTRFAVDMLERAGLVKKQGQASADFIQHHFQGRPDDPVIYGSTGPVIVTLRNKGEVEKSWRRRKRGLGDLWAKWDEMERFLDTQSDVHLLRVDDPDNRDSDLQALSDRLGIPLTADFSLKLGHNK